MKLLFDTRWIGQHGIGRYASVLAEQISGIIPMAGQYKPTSPLDSIWLSFQLYKRSPDLFFTPGFNAPLYSRVPYILTVHDLIHLTDSEEVSLLKKLYYHFVLLPAIKKAYCVLTVSEYSKQQIVNWSGVDPSKVIVTYAGVDSDFFQPAAPKYQHPQPYLLYVGNVRPHKNIRRLLVAFAASKLSHDFILVAKATEQLKELIRELELTERITFCSNVSEEELAQYYRGASAVCLVSTCEGFGLPALEALSCGTPVLAADNTSLPEVLGEEAVYVDPYCTNSIVRGLHKVSQQRVDQQSKQKRHAQAKQFSWQGVVARVQSVLQQFEGDHVRRS